MVDGCECSRCVKIKKSFVTRCTLIRPEFFLKVSCVFIFLLHDLIENPSKISEILLCNLKKGLKGQNSGQTFKVGITNPRGFFDLSNFYLVKLVSLPLLLRLSLANKASISKSFLNLQKLISTSYCQCKKVEIKATKQKMWFWYISKVVVRTSGLKSTN